MEKEHVVVKRVYISGKISGTDDFMKRFQHAEDLLKTLGVEVVNPAKANETLPETFKWGDYMKVSMALLSLCDTVYMLSDWKDSAGAMTEHEYAKKHGYAIIYENAADRQ